MCQERAGICLLINLKFKIVVTLLLPSFSLSKIKNSETARPMVRTPTPQSPVLFCVFTLFLLFLFVFHRKNIVLLHLMNRYATSTSEYSLKGKGIKVDFWYQWIIQCHTDNRCEHLVGGDNIYLYGSVSLLVPECAVYLFLCVCVCVCVISNQSASKKPHYVSDFSKFDALLHKI